MCLSYPTLIENQKNGSVVENRNAISGKEIHESLLFCIMAIQVVEFSNGGYKIRKIFA